jgi:deazaflavin-dependent oxidoreductase (nitroreductase family)
MADEIDFHAFNAGLVEQFRAQHGEVDGDFKGWPLVLITHRGAKSGKEYTTPLVYTRDGDHVVVIASKGGAPDDPQWFRNLRANPDVTVEIGADTYPARARLAEGDERDRLYDAQATLMPNFAEYAAKTSRVIPVVVLERS